MRRSFIVSADGLTKRGQGGSHTNLRLTSLMDPDVVCPLPLSVSAPPTDADGRGTRVIFPNGEIDPWHALGVLEAPSPQLPTIYVQGEARSRIQLASDPRISIVSSARKLYSWPLRPPPLVHEQDARMRMARSGCDGHE